RIGACNSGRKQDGERRGELLRWPLSARVPANIPPRHASRLHNTSFRTGYFLEHGQSFFLKYFLREKSDKCCSVVRWYMHRAGAGCERGWYLR
ncbi:unnamed protein product, partial [Ectocarpus sp. 12 AP-2014]